MNFVWNKPVLTFYRERTPREKEPFAVVKAIKLEISVSEKEGYIGEINAFFPLMAILTAYLLLKANRTIMSYAGLMMK